MKEAALWLWSHIFVLLLKLRINFYVKTYLCLPKHIVLLCVRVTVDTVIASYCATLKQPYNVLMYSGLFIKTS